LKDNAKPQSDYVKRLMPTYEYILHFIKDPKMFFYREFKLWKEDGQYGVGRGSKDSGFGHKMKTHTWTLKKPLERFRNFLSEQRVKEVLHANGFNWTELKDIDPTFRHLAPYPSVIPLLPILLTTKIGDTVLDIYNGTSTTTAVALQLGRKVIGYDTDTESHMFAAKRLYLVGENLPTNLEVLEFENEFIKDSEDQSRVAA
jgi:DNA modification methylase